MKSRPRILGAAVIALSLGGVLTAATDSATLMSLLAQATIYAVLATAPGLLLRQNGMVSFGHGLFFGAVGYIVGILLQLRLMPAELAILSAIACVSSFAFVYGLIIVRVPGIAFGMITLAVAQMFYVTAARSRGLTGGADGMNIQWPSTISGAPLSILQRPGVMFMVSWTVLVVVLAAVAFLLSGRFGALTEAVRDNEERARFIGIRTLLPRAAIFALSACIASIGGVLSAIYTGFVSPESMDLSVSAIALMMVVVGGTRALWGPALGAMVYFLTKDSLGAYSDHWMGIFGVALIAVIVFWPQGIAGALQSFWRRVAQRPLAPHSAARTATAAPRTPLSTPAAADPARFDLGPPA